MNRSDKRQQVAQMVLNGELDNLLDELLDAQQDDGTFDKWWNLYDKKVDREYCEKKWKRIPKKHREAIFEHTQQYVICQPNKQFRRNPKTYLNAKTWNTPVSDLCPGSQPTTIDSAARANLDQWGSIFEQRPS